MKAKFGKGFGLAMITVAAASLGACGGPKSAGESGEAATATETAAPAPAVVAAAAPKRDDFDQAAAAKLYLDNCAACHQAKGEGMEGIYPAFPGNAVVNGPVDDLLRVLLEGRGGMPSFLADMTPQEIALVTNHMRNEWSTQRDLVTAEQVSAVATGLKQASGDARKDD